MRRENWFVIILVALCMGLATMAAVSSSPPEADKTRFESLQHSDELAVAQPGLTGD